jgi:aspartate/tyrosine/aromatic aminotransferase
MIPQLLPSRAHFPADDRIFALNAAAQRRAAEGAPVINATVGALLDDRGELVVLDTVMRTWAQLTPREVAPYAPLGGDPAYLTALARRHWPQLATAGVGVATTGGSGALALSIRNLLEPGQGVLAAAPYWGPYATLAQENGVRLVTVPWPMGGASLDVARWEEAARALLDAQGRLLLWLNDPCHNPTGTSLSAADRQALLAMLRRLAARGPVTLLLDLAYLDYARDPAAVDAALADYAAFGGEGGVLVGAALSLSKAFTLYGARAGALVFPWCDDRALQSALVFSCRGTWSNCPRAPMHLLLRLTQDPQALAALAAEHAHWRGVLTHRAAALGDALAHQGLPPLAWDGGFFVTLSAADPEGAAAALQAKDIFVVPMPEGLRVGICGMRAADAPRFAAGYAELL